MPVQVHTKYVPDLDRLPTHSRADVVRGVDRSLARLGVERLDLVQLHWWDYDVPGYVEAAAWLDELRRAGKIRHVGLTNFDQTRLEEIVAAGVPIVSHQVQYSVLDRRPADGMATLCARHGIGLLCYGALAGGFLSERYLGRADPAAPLENRSLVKYRLIIDEFGGWDRFQEMLAALGAVAARHGVGIGAVAIRWVLDQPGVSGVIVGARHARHLDQTQTGVRARARRRRPRRDCARPICVGRSDRRCLRPRARQRRAACVGHAIHARQARSITRLVTSEQRRSCVMRGHRHNVIGECGLAIAAADQADVTHVAATVRLECRNLQFVVRRDALCQSSQRCQPSGIVSANSIFMMPVRSQCRRHQAAECRHQTS